MRFVQFLFFKHALVQEGASSIAIDGRWGSGKTFFVKQSMLLRNAKNPCLDFFSRIFF